MVFERGAGCPASGAAPPAAKERQRGWRSTGQRTGVFRLLALQPGDLGLARGLGPGDGRLAAEGVQLLEGGFWEVDALAKGGRLVEAEVVVLTIGDAASWRFPWPEQLSSADEQLNVFDCRAIGCSSGSPARSPSPTWPTGVIA
jgi:hypothetical protein